MKQEDGTFAGSKVSLTVGSVVSASGGSAVSSSGGDMVSASGGDMGVAIIQIGVGATWRAVLQWRRPRRNDEGPLRRRDLPPVNNQPRSIRHLLTANGHTLSADEHTLSTDEHALHVACSM